MGFGFGCNCGSNMSAAYFAMPSFTCMPQNRNLFSLNFGGTTCLGGNGFGSQFFNWNFPTCGNGYFNPYGGGCGFGGFGWC